MASGKNGTLYVGVTVDLIKRVHEHRTSTVDGFTQRHHVHNLVYYEQFSTLQDSIAREKQLKNWKREWKIEMIEKNNPGWLDLYDTLI